MDERMEGFEGRGVTFDWEGMKVSSGSLPSKLFVEVVELVEIGDSGGKWGRWPGRGRSDGVVY